MNDQVHPDLAAGLRRLPTLTFTRRNYRLIGLLYRVLGLKRERNDGISISRIKHDGLPLRVYAPRNRQPVAALLWIHGGGMIVGTARGDDTRCMRFASELGALVVSPDYRLAPKHPFPAALDDCVNAWLWTVERATDLGVSPDRVSVAGASAGGGLAASLAQRMHDEGGTAPAAQLLVYPMLDDRTAAREDIGLREHLVWNRESNITGWSSYLGSGGEEPAPYAAPARRGDLSGLPPSWIGVGSLDLFLDESREYAQRLMDAGVPCELQVVDGAFHGFEAMIPTPPVSQGFVEAQVKFLRRNLNAK